MEGNVYLKDQSGNPLGTATNPLHVYYDAQIGATTLNGLSDVIITLPVEGEVLTYDATGVWKNGEGFSGYSSISGYATISGFASNAALLGGASSDTFAAAGHNHNHNDLDNIDGGTYHLDITAYGSVNGWDVAPLVHSHTYVDVSGYATECGTASDSQLLDGKDSSEFATVTHHTTHESGGGDAIKLDDLSAPDDNTHLDASTSKHGLLLKATAPAANELNVVGIANGETAYANKALFDATNPEALGTVGPGTATVAARRDHVHTMPTLDGVAAPSDVTTLNVSASAHGLCPKFPNNSTTFFRGDGTYAAPPKGGVLTWSEVTGTTQALAVNTGYILNHATTMIVATLPSTAAVGDVIRIVGKGAAMWKVAQNASQYIRFAGLTTTTGTGGYLQAENAYDCIEIMCTTANNGWTVISSIGNIVVV